MMFMVMGVWMSSCNTDTDTEDEIPDLSSEYAVMVKSFRLRENSKVLLYIDSVFFAIDLNNAEIYNPDSLPKGTRIDKLPVSIGLPSVSKAEITMPGSTGADTVVNYLTNSTDSINFTRGSVQLKLVSANGLAERTYTIRVNVHLMSPDSLCWGSVAMSGLPTTLSAPERQKTVEYGGKAVTFVKNASGCTRAISDNPGTGEWDIADVILPQNALVETITASDDAIYLIDSNDMLYMSSDMGDTWEETGKTMCHIYGANGVTLAGVRREADGAFVHVTYPDGNVSAIPAGCPVSGTSAPLVYETKWSAMKQMVVIGGRTASGELTGEMWAFDGVSWAKISSTGLPAAEGMTLLPYFAFRVATDWVVTESSVMMAFGGIDASNNCVSKVYLSNDRGLHWYEAGQLMQLPEEISPRAYAQALVFKTVFNADSRGWSDNISLNIPFWYDTVSSRAVAPVDEWECPYIYLFGGVSADGILNDTVWRGVINRLSFKPLQ